MAKDKSDLILNITGEFITGKKIVNGILAQKLYNSRLKIGEILKGQDYNLAPEYTYLITGGSGKDGCPLVKSLTSNLAIKLRIKGQKSKKRRLPNLISDNVRVIDLKAIKKD